MTTNREIDETARTFVAVMTGETLEQRASRLLDEATAKAWNSLAHGKFSLFGYWAAKVVQFRELLGRSSEPSPFRELTDTAKIVCHVNLEKPAQ